MSFRSLHSSWWRLAGAVVGISGVLVVFSGQSRALERAAVPVARIQHALYAVLSHQVEETPGWPWHKDDLRPAPNTGGVVAVSLLGSYEQQPDPATWVTLVQYAGHLRERYAPPDSFPYKADIELLALLDQAGMDRGARPTARELFDRVRQRSATGRDEYQRIAIGRSGVPEIVGYDIALSIRAALAVGERAYAEDLADAAISAGDLALGDPGDSYRVTAVGSLLHAVSLLGRGEDQAVLLAAAAALVRAQGDDGSWAMANTQATAYAVLGLHAAADLPGADARARAAVDKGRAWLLARQLAAGGFAAYHDGLPEPFVGPVIPLAEAEALAALLATN